jgi:hypothetical protein
MFGTYTYAVGPAGAAAAWRIAKSVEAITQTDVVDISSSTPTKRFYGDAAGP